MKKKLKMNKKDNDTSQICVGVDCNTNSNNFKRISSVDFFPENLITRSYLKHPKIYKASER